MFGFCVVDFAAAAADCDDAACLHLQREFCRDLFYAANTTYNERPERLTLEEEIKINEVGFVGCRSSQV